ncbi:hypothetical protein E4631_05200 [Hymenobacter sp. UV11]|uniref:hypothetical protein n=1 Tax=Hymenobacter sp. UV11 TaxID=1849735 RepID=UPI00105C80F4|nr:hypothetical protein [Hymenobacter sp. UV11]TDN35780.1 hypothetical protein A8B98_12050 [Hymenobacter sp. UV11]TFZ67384.1 hypothetical protein E4631_05200 [Hymenobacter sp. UV11]
MNAKNLLLALAATFCFGSASAQTAPISPRASQAPATMASPNTTRSSMSNAAEGTGTVVTQPTGNEYGTSGDATKRKTTKHKGEMMGAKDKMKTKM